jgi:hypothetical protein
MLDIGDHGVRGVLVVLAFGQVQQFAGAAQSLGQLADAVDGLVEQRTLAPQGLRPLGVVPDVRVFQFAFYFLQALALGVVVKETPSAHPADRSGRRCAGARD